MSPFNANRGRFRAFSVEEGAELGGTFVSEHTSGDFYGVVEPPVTYDVEQARHRAGLLVEGAKYQPG